MADDDYNEDDDDFEDYEDEFEPDEAEQAEADIQQALQQEEEAMRERLKQANKGPVKTQFLASKPAIEQPVSAPKKHLIAPPTQSSRELRAQKTARLEALRKVIQLRTVDMLLYDASPLTAYELHTRHHSRHLRAKSSQTRDDDVEVGVQTEPPEAGELGCQVPEDLGTAGRNTALSKSEGAQTASLLSANTARLNRFLRSAGLLMESLCSENMRSAAGGFSSTHALPVSVRAATMRLPEQLGPRALVDVSFAAEGDTLLAAYGVDAEAAEEPRPKGKKEAARRLLGAGLLGVWRLQQTEAPWQLLRCIGLPSCCLFLRRSHLAVCGTHEGGVQLWDLREPASQHASAEVGGAQVTLRSPTFCSDAATGNHTSPVVAITELPSSAGEEEVSVASLEQQGTVLIWLLIETQDHEPSATDYGQAVGGRVRLFRSGHVPLNAGQYDANATGEEVARRRGVGDAALLPLRTLCLAFSPAEASRFLVGCDTGRVLHGSRHAGRSVAMPTPRTFEPEVSHATAGVPACTVHGLAFCPLAGLQGYMVAARSDGSLALYQTDDARPLRTWQGFTTAALLQVVWSQVRPCVLWLLDADATLHVFDLLDSEDEPVLSCPLRPAAPRCPPPLGRSDGAAARLRIALGTRPQARESEAPSMLALTCSFAADESCLDVHLLTERLSQPVEGEAEQLQRFLESL